MELLLQTTTLTSKSTESTLSIDGNFECFTLELPVVDGKPGSAIPSGRFRIKLGPSPKFEKSSDPWVMKYAKLIPHLVIEIDEFGRSNILIHWGNNTEDTEGCILVGQGEGEDFISNSRKAFEALHAKLLAAWNMSEDIWITVAGRNP